MGAFLEKMYSIGLIPTKWNLDLCDKINASSFCRRRLPVLLVRSKMAENLKSATQLIEQGHVRVGTDIVKDPAFLVTRNLGFRYMGGHLGNQEACHGLQRYT